MLPAVSSVVSADTLPKNQFTAFETFESFFTGPCPNAKSNPGSDLCRYHADFVTGPDDLDQKPPSLGEEPNLNSNQDQNPIKPNSVSEFGSENPSRNSADFNSGSFDSNQNSPGSGSDELNPMDVRKQRRMISNRESARRSRVRKQRHVENLRNQVNRLKKQNRENANRLQLITQHIYLVMGDNHRLRTESIFLQRRLTEYIRILRLRQLQQNYSSSSSISSSSLMQGLAIYNMMNLNNNEQTIPPSLII